MFFITCSVNQTPIQNKIQNKLCRRDVLFSLSSFIPVFVTKGESQAGENLTPYQQAQTIEYGLKDGRIRSCPSNVNPNCISTSSTNSSYSAAWRSQEADAKTSAQILEGAFLRLFPEESALIDSVSLLSGEYRAFAVDSLFGKDVVEFMIRNADPIKDDRNWEGDTEGPIVTYRSMAGSVKYVWPIQQPISDFGVQKKRLDQIRTDLGWKIVGCELLECYQ
eukprot:TRINITY_DN5307_c0_g1_i11.p3 TRINITY_DN5307_c0_g1~~TRINITY_DN5307_c0_g1_i11.p3  ORF type:complete len:252 (-),score=19.65 TRINITY_DN5307_c0_g1_i11:133-795(-)